MVQLSLPLCHREVKVMHTRVLWTILTLVLLAAACVSSREENPLPTPDAACPVTLEWHGVVPGRTTRQDVVEVLGHPSQKGTLWFDERHISFYSYPVEGGTVSGYVEDRVFFRPDGVVDWIEVVVADRDGGFHSVQETIDQLGNTLDTVYLNNNYNPSNSFPIDVLSGPDQIYVWSECGLVLDALAVCLPYEEADIPGCATPEDATRSGISVSITVMLRYPDPHYSLEPIPDANSPVLMKFLFPPSSYEGFNDSYRYKIPFGLWDTYIRREHIGQ
jgi:hypothetical protein